MDRIFAKLLYEIEKNQDTVLVTIIADRGSAPRGAGSQMLVGSNGRILGTIGGGAVEAYSEKIALEQLAKKKSRIHDFQLHKNATEDIGMVCGGAVKVFFQYIPGDSSIWQVLAATVLERITNRQAGWLTLKIDGSAPSLVDGAGASLLGDAVAGKVTHKVWLPDQTAEVFSLPLPIGERAFIFGGGHCAQALAPLLTTVGFRVTVMDNREEYANRDNFPNVETLIVGDYTHLADYIEFQDDEYAVIMTNGHSFDFDVEEQLLRRTMAYVGVIGSRSKKAAVNQRLREAGITEDAIATVHSPIGISIKAVTPEEIAVSIASELILVRAQRRELCGGTAKACPMS